MRLAIALLVAAAFAGGKDAVADEARPATEPPAAVEETKDDYKALGRDESQATYERKSITYLQMLGRAGADSDVYSAAERETRRNVELARFDYNDVSRFSGLGPQEAARLVKEYLDKVKIERAREQAEYDVRFKDLTITGDDLRRIANSAYLYQPVLNHSRVFKERYVIYRRGYPVVVHRWVAKLSVEVRFYSVDFAEGVAKEMAVIAASGSGWATVGALSGGNPRAQAIAEAAASAGKQLNKDVRKIDVFNLLTPINAAGFNSVNFALSRKEGLKLDQGFYVYDYLSEGGRERVGYVRVTRVGDGENVLDSEAQNITVRHGLGFEEGQLLEEHPQMGIRVTPSGGWQRFKLRADRGLDIRKTTGGARLGAEISYDIADQVGWPEVYAVAGAHVMVSNFPEYGAEVGLDKRFYLRRLVLTPGLRIGYLRSMWSFDPDNPLFDSIGNPEDLVSLNGDSLGVTPRLGAELFLTPEWSLTARAEYRLYTPASLSNSDTGASYDLSSVFEYNPSGLAVMGGISYSF